MKPARVQRKRTKGFRLPPNTVCVTRGTKYGNPYVVGKDGSTIECVKQYAEMMVPYTHHGKHNGMGDFLLSEAVMTEIERDLKGKNIACFCALCEKHKDGLPFGEHCKDCPPCHGKWLLEVANK